MRPDVVVVTYPLLGAGWYRDELYRRASLGTPPPHDSWAGMRRELATIARSAAEQARPLAVAVTVERPFREMIAPRWRLSGLVYLVAIDSIARQPPSGPGMTAGDLVMDPIATESAAKRLEPLVRRELRRTIDPTSRLMQASLRCPSIALRAAADTTAARLLESTCNSR
jgi:hypothetical protein